MPELPEVEVLCRRLGERVVGRRVETAELASISALRTVEPPLSSIEGLSFSSVERRGKNVAAGLGDRWLVFSLALGGWVRWRESMPAATRAGAPRRGPLALRVRLEGGSAFEVTEMGTEKRVRIWVVTAPEAIEEIATLGPDPLDPGFSRDDLGALLARETGHLKHALSRQSVIAGVGNAYSDEILHAARLSPFKAASKLSGVELDRLYGALRAVLSDALERASALDLGELKGSKRESMRVHGRTGQPCSVCGDVVREVAFASRSLQYCATCQTGGRPLADRRLSRLLK